MRTYRDPGRRYACNALAGSLGVSQDTPTVNAASQAVYQQVANLVSAQGFARYMVDLQGVISTYRDARDAYSAAGIHGQAAVAEGRRVEVLRLYDALAEVYRADPSFGLQGPSRGLGLPQAVAIGLGAIVAIIGTYSLLTYLAARRDEAAAALQDAKTAADACALDPHSPGCVAALETRQAGIEAAAGKSSPWDALVSVAKWAAIAVVAFKLFEMLSSRSKRRSAEA